MTGWIFRGNREDFDIDQYIKNFEYIYWAVKHPKHQEEIQIGDHIFIWRSKGKSRDPYGLIAFGTVVECPVHKTKVKYPKYLLEEYLTKTEVSPIKVGIKLQDKRLSLESGLIESAILQSDPELAKMQLLTARQGTNFRLSSSELNLILSLWHGTENEFEEEEYVAQEGKAKLRTHKLRERDPLLVKKAKERFERANGALFCEVCGYNFMSLRHSQL